MAISADCADAYNLLAQEEAKTIAEAKELYHKGMEAGRRALGENICKDSAGYLWGYLPSRPYMRSCFGYMECLWISGEYDEAIAQAREMLKLNKNDNQGVRYVLAAYLTDFERYEDLAKLLNSREYKDDCAAEWLHTKALLSFVQQGDSNNAKRNLAIALKTNHYVPEYMTGKKAIPRSLPDAITMGGKDEGFCYASRFLDAWKRVPGAIRWLEEKAADFLASRQPR